MEPIPNERRKEIAASMYIKGAVSIELAAKISGLPITEFVKYLKEKGIKPFSAVEEDLDIAERL
jgi:predicted HTH domain antitoxin